MSDLIGRLLANSVAFGQVSKDGKEHALRPHWADDSVWATVCNPRRYYPMVSMFSVDAEPSGGYRGPCIQPSCNRAREAWLKVHIAGRNGG